MVGRILNRSIVTVENVLSGRYALMSNCTCSTYIRTAYGTTGTRTSGYVTNYIISEVRKKTCTSAHRLSAVYLIIIRIVSRALMRIFVNDEEVSTESLILSDAGPWDNLDSRG